MNSSFRLPALALIVASSGLFAGCGVVGVTGTAGGLSLAQVAPSVATQPKSVTVNDGETAAFSVLANGSAPFSYRWRRNGQVIPGATASTYNISAAALASSGEQFSVVISNTAGSVTSSAATLTVQAVAPSIVAQPQAQSVMEGAAATFVVVTNGSAPLTFAWTKNGIVIPGATNASYVTPLTSLGDSGALFAVRVSNVVGTVTSTSAMLAVDSAAVAPSIVSQPQNASTTVGGSVTFAVQAQGTAPLSYQWQRNGADIGGATNASYTLATATMQNNQDAYSATVRNIAGTAVSQRAVLTLTAPAVGIQLIAGQLGGAGALDGIGGAARFYCPEGTAVDSAGNLYVADNTRNTIRKVSPTGVVTTVAGLAGNAGSADGIGATARFNAPAGVAIDLSGNLFVADAGNSTIRMITPAGVVSTLAGTPGTTGSVDGLGAAALFNSPQGVATDVAGNVYVADTANGTLRKVTAGGNVTTLAGTPGVFGAADGAGSAAQFSGPRGIAVDASGSVYVADTDNSTIRKITPAGTVSTLAGTPGTFGAADGTAGAAQFSAPIGVATDAAGNVYVADSGNQSVRKISPAGAVTTLAGSGVPGYADGIGAAAQFQTPWGIAADAAGNLYLGDFNNSAIRKVSPAGVVTTVAGRAGAPGLVDGTGSAAQFNDPQGVTVDAAGNIYVADTGNNTVRKTTALGVVSTLAGAPGVSGAADGTGSAAQFNSLRDLVVDPSGLLYVADTGNNTIRKITAAGEVSTFAGTAGVSGAADGSGSMARFNAPRGITEDASGNLYVVDTGNNTIRKITAAGVVTTLAGTPGVTGAADGTGGAAQFNGPRAIAVDTSANLYIADMGNGTIREITPTGVVTTLAGTPGVIGSADGIAGAAQFNAPVGVAADSAGNVYVTDNFNHVVRKVTPAGVVTTLAGVTSDEGVVLGALPGALNSPVRIAVVPGPAVELVVSDNHENSILSITLP